MFLDTETLTKNTIGVQSISLNGGDDCTFNFDR